MQVTELVEMMKEFQRILMLNKEAMPEKLMGDIDELLVKINDPTVITSLKLLFGDTVETILTSLQKVLEIEKKLLSHAEGEACLADKLHQTLGNLQHRPLVLNSIAWVI